MSIRRASRIAETIRREISTMLLKQEIKDPRIGFVTITRVEVSSNLKEVEVYITYYGKDSGKNRSLEGLRSAAGFVGKEICTRLHLRLVPSIKFLYDEKLEKAMNVLKIMDSLHSDEK